MFRQDYPNFGRAFTFPSRFLTHLSDFVIEYNGSKIDKLAYFSFAGKESEHSLTYNSYEEGTLPSSPKKGDKISVKVVYEFEYAEFLGYITVGQVPILSAYSLTIEHDEESEISIRNMSVVSDAEIKIEKLDDDKTRATLVKAIDKMRDIPYYQDDNHALALGLSVRYKGKEIICSSAPCVNSFMNWYTEKFYKDMSKKKGFKGPESLPTEVIDGLKAAKSRFDTVKVLYEYSRDHIEYAQVNTLNAGHVPTPPKYVIERGWGDCKGKSMLIASMGEALGIPIDIALASTKFYMNDTSFVAPNDFNHMVAIWSHEGKDYILDATDKYLPFTLTPTGLTGKSLMKVYADNPSKKNVDPAWYSNLREDEIVLSINDMKTMKGTFKATLRDHSYSNFMNQYEDLLGEERDFFASKFLTDYVLSTAVFANASINISKENGTVVITGDLDASDVGIQFDGKVFIPKFPLRKANGSIFDRAGDNLPIQSSFFRKQKVKMEFAAPIQDPSVSRIEDGNSGSLSIKAENIGSKGVVTWDFVTYGGLLDGTAKQKYIDFWKSVQNLYSSTFTLQP